MKAAKIPWWMEAPLMFWGSIAIVIVLCFTIAIATGFARVSREGPIGSTLHALHLGGY